MHWRRHGCVAGAGALGCQRFGPASLLIQPPGDTTKARVYLDVQHQILAECCMQDFSTTKRYNESESRIRHRRHGWNGTAICQRLHKEGLKVIALAAALRATTSGGWPSRRPWATPLYAPAGNVGDWDSTVEAYARPRPSYAAASMLVNNGITRDRMFVKMTREDWDAVIETNLNSIFNVTKQVVADMVEKGWGRIVNISPVNGERPGRPDQLGSAAKAGMHGFLHGALAQELGFQGATVNTTGAGLYRY